MRKRSLLPIVIVLIVVMACVFAACTKKDDAPGTVETLAAPQNVQVTDTIIRWDEVENAIGYIITINEGQYPSMVNMFDFTTTGLGKGNYIISVVAVGDRKKYNDSPSSSAQLFEYQGATYTLHVIAEEGGTTSVSQKKYNANDVVDLVAYPQENYHFDGWFSDNYYKLSSSTDFSFNINSNTVLYAHFSPNPEVLDKTSEESSSLMRCDENFAVVVYCPEANAESYIRDHFFVYDSFFLDEDGNVATDAMAKYNYPIDLAMREIGTIEARNNDLYVIHPRESYEASGAYVARATGNVSILKEYTRLVNGDVAFAAAGADLYLAAAEEDTGREEMGFSIDNTEHETIALAKNVYIWSYGSNVNATSLNVDGWIIERIGSGMVYGDEDMFGGFTTASIVTANGHTLVNGDIVGFGGNITKDISVEQFSEDTIFGRVRKVEYLGEDTQFSPIIYVELEPVEKVSDVFSVLDVYKEGELDIGDYIEEHQEELTAEAMAMFTQSDDYHRFLATVSAATESYAEENDLSLVGVTNMASFLDKVKIEPTVGREGNKMVFSITGKVEIEFGKKETTAIKASGKFTVSFEFKETIGFDYGCAFITTRLLWLDIPKGISFNFGTMQETDFVFDAAVVYSVATQTHTDFILNTSKKKVHLPECPWVRLMKDQNKREVVGTVVEWEKKGYQTCQHCLRSKFVLNKSTKCLHRNGCLHVKQMLDSNKFYSNRDMDDLIKEGYWACGTCHPTNVQEVTDNDATENFRVKINDGLKYEDWGDKIKEIKKCYENADSLPNADKDFAIIKDLPFHCGCVMIHLSVYLTLSFNIEASVHYEQHTSNRTELVIRATIDNNGFQKEYKKTENCQTEEFTLVGKVNLKAGVKLDISVSDLADLVRIGIYGSLGVYADLVGVLHVSDKGENYAAAYFEMGFYYDFGVDYNVLHILKGSASLVKITGLDGEIFFLKKGYSKAIYAYVNDVEKTLMQASEGKKVFTLQELGLMEVKHFTLPGMKTGTETLDPTSSDYIVKLKLEKGQYLEIDGVNIRVKDNAPFGEEFEDVLTISIVSRDRSWRDFKEGSSILYLPTIQVKLTVANKCQEHVYLYLEEVEPDCTTKGYEACLMCSRCRKLFSVIGSTDEDDDSYRIGGEIAARKEIASLGHAYAVLDRVEPTCIASGITEGTVCTRCGEIGIAQEYIDALGHVGSETWELVRSATCASQGTECNHCARCDVILDYRPILPTGHTPSTHEQKCGEAVTCAVCGETLAAARAHDFRVVNEQEATCTADGFKQYACSYSNCTEEYTEVLPALGHLDSDADYNAAVARGDVEVIKSRSCEEDGEYLYHCARCDAELVRTDPKRGHRFAEIPTVDAPATCTTAGKMSYHCQNPGCAAIDPDKGELTTAALGHDNGEWVITKVAGCETDGSRQRTCKRCGEPETETLLATGHQWGELLTEEDKYPTCTRTGESYRVCSTCGKRQYVYPAALGHDPIAEATCEEDSVCRRCKQPIAVALGHDFVLNEETSTVATCENQGVRYYKCSRCDETKEETIAATGHDWLLTDTIDATCTETRKFVYTCQNDGCGKEEIVADTSLEGRALGHDFAMEYTIDREPTCTAAGEKSRHCSRCEARTDVLTIEKTPHKYGESLPYPYEGEGKKTCDLVGSGYQECADCGTKKDVAIGHTASGGSCLEADVCTRCGVELAAAEGHDFSTISFEQPSTCVTYGYIDWKCSRCSEQKRENLPLANHNEKAVVTTPTCEEDGYTTYICDVCNASRTVAGEDALGHAYTNNVVPETCEEDGYTEHTCSRCGDYYTDAIVSAHGHTWVEIESERVAPTCEKAGSATYECRCEQEECSATKTEVLAATGHTKVYHEAVVATCAENGTKAYYSCENCSKLFDKYDNETTMAALVVSDPDNHDIVHHAAQAPTCTAVGWYAYDTCLRCSYTTYVEISATGHTTVTDAAVAATCTATGLTAGSHCSVCSAVIQAQEVTPATGHAYGALIEEVSATCTEIGTAAHYKCSVCKTFFDAEQKLTTAEALVIPATGHTYGTLIAKKSATCTEEGMAAHYECSVCHTFFDASKKVTTKATLVIPATGHTYKDCGFKENSCFVDGYDAHYSCTVCGKYFVQELNNGKFEMIEKEWSEIERKQYGAHQNPLTVEQGTNKPSGCNEQGYEIWYCSRCNAYSETHYLTMPAHEDKTGDGKCNSCGCSIDLTYAVSGDGYVVTGYAGSLTEIVIPTYYNQKKVVGIKASAFEGKTAITSVIMPDTITSIGNYAFRKCTGLTSLTLPNGIKSVGVSSFSRCTGLTSITIPASLTAIGDFAFDGCFGLTSITVDADNPVYHSAGNCLIRTASKTLLRGCQTSEIPSDGSVTTIGHSAFWECFTLTSITIPSTVTSFDGRVFYDCTSLKSITIPASVTSIGMECFKGDELLEFIFFEGTSAQWNAIAKGSDWALNAGTMTPKGTYTVQFFASGLIYALIGNSYTVTGIGSCTETDILIPSTYNGKPVTAIGNNAFNNCKSLTSVTIPDSVTLIGGNAFDNCKALSFVTIGNGVTSIESAFYSCFDLMSVTIGSGVTSIGSSAFYGCYKLVEVYNKSSLTIEKGETDNGYVGYYAKAVYTSEYVSKISTDANGYVLYTDGSEKSLIDYVGNEKMLTLPAGITAINRGAFLGRADLISITIPSSVKSIGEVAFKGCYKLVEIYNKSSLAITKGEEENGSIGYYAKAVYTSAYTSKLSTDANGYVIYTDGSDKSLIDYIGNAKVLSIPSGIKEINQYAFYGRDDLTSITISNGVTTIGDSAFSGCYKLVEVYNKSALTIEKGKTNNGRVGYYAKAVYTSAYTSKLSTDANGYVLYTDGSEKSLIDYIGSAKVLSLPSGITEIHQYAFYGRDDLLSVTIPNSVTSVGSYAFYDCDGLTSITIPNSVTKIGGYAFYDCDGLTSITIPNSMTDLGADAFENCNRLVSATIGIGVTGINASTFRNCTALTSITIPNNVTEIGSFAFYDCISLTHVVLSQNLNRIYYDSFTRCDSLDEESRQAIDEAIAAYGRETCLVAGTMITLADGTMKVVEDVEAGDLLLVWDLSTGTYGAAPVVFNDGEEEAEYTIIYVTFSDGTVVGIATEHGFFDLDLGAYVYLDENAAQYIGHRFIDQSGNEVTLESVEIRQEVVAVYSPVTYKAFCYYANGLLSMPGGIAGLMNPFAVDVSTMTYDEEQMARDLALYGLLDYSDVAEIMPEELFDSFNGEYLNVLIGKGLISWDTIYELMERYLPLCE